MCREEETKIWRPLAVMSSNIETVLKTGKALIPYITFGDPHKSFTKDIVLACFEAGADIVEIGIPFSDPVADGPVIQASHQRALLADPDLNLVQAFQLVKDVKKTCKKPLVFMSAVNLIYRFGITKFFKQAAACGLDGVIIPDLSIEEAEAYLKDSKKYNVDLILLLSPLCSPKRLKAIVKATSGFLYVMSSVGITGTRTSISDGLSDVVKKVKQIRDIPVCIGFGISTPQHVASVFKYAEGAIVGSYLVNVIAKHSADDFISQLKKAVSQLKP
jgi:tryptophan synthase alpha chain